MAGDNHGAETTQEQEAAQEHGNEQVAQDQQEVTASAGDSDSVGEGAPIRGLDGNSHPPVVATPHA